MTIFKYGSLNIISSILLDSITDLTVGNLNEKDEPSNCKILTKLHKIAVPPCKQNERSAINFKKIKV